MSRKPNSECQIMVFRPTMEEFSDFSRYIQYMESQGAHRGGVAKIIPPTEWSPCKSYDNIDNLEIPAPISQVVTGQKGLYTQYNIQQKPMTVKEMRRLTNTDRYASPFHESYEDLERTYWKNITFNPAIYGADISGSLYDKDVDVWNIARLDTILDMVENDTGVKIEGVNTAYLYFGMWKTSFAWHTEDMDLYSINYVHFGAPKTWYSVPPEHGKRLERLASGFFPNSNSTCPAFLRHKMTLISPNVLKQYGIPFNKITQEAGEFMITFPYGYHSGFNHGFNCAESTNFASERWIDYGVASEKCRCRKDMVYINMDLFVKTFQPDKYERWKERKLEVKLSYTDIPTVPDFSTKPIHWRTRIEEIRKLSITPKKLGHAPKAKTHKTPSPSKAKKTASPRKDSLKRPLGISKMPMVRIEKSDLLPCHPSLSEPTSPAKKSSGKRALSTGSAESLQSSSIPSTSGCLLSSPQKTTYQIKMGSVLPMSALTDHLLASTSEQESTLHFPTLMDRVKMSRRKLPSEGSIHLSSSGLVLHPATDTSLNPPKTDFIVQLPENTDHTMYTKALPGLKNKSKISPQPQQKYAPLPVKMQIMNTSGSPFAHLRAIPPEVFKLVEENGNSETIQPANTVAENMIRDIKVTESEITAMTPESLATSSSQVLSSTVPKIDVESSPPISAPLHLSSPPSSSSQLDQTSKPQGSLTKDVLLTKTSRPPIKRRHPVSKKGPSKKTSPAVVLKSASADSESSDDDVSGKNQSHVKRPRGKSNTKSEHYVETEGYPTLWPRRKVSFKAEKQYNATVAKLSPHCAICTLFHPYYQRSFHSNNKPPPLLDVLKSTTAPKPGTKTKPLISEIIFATSTDNPAPLATCELLDDEGKSELIQCKVCKVQVHASCYGMTRIENPWTCDRCSFKAWIAQCSLCCMRGGALKPVNDGLQWAHILCALSIPEVSFDDIPRRNGINLKKLSQIRHKLRCTYCRRNKSREVNLIGTCIQCCAGPCAISFHPTCAHAAGVKMEPGDWPLPVFVYCHRHALQKKRALENKSEKTLPDVSLEQRVWGKHRNKRYYPCVIRAEKSQTFHHVIFTDKSWSDNLYAEDITSHNFVTNAPKQGDVVTVKWTDGKFYDGEYFKEKKRQVLDVEFEDGSVLSVKREDVYTDMDDMPKRIRRKLSNATLMSDPHYLESPKKPTDSLSYASKKAAFHRKRKENRAATLQQQESQEIPIQPVSSISHDICKNDSLQA